MYFIPIIFVMLLISGTAFAYLMGSVAVLTFFAVDKAQFLSILPQRIFAQLDVFAFMAMPLFILTAEIMSRAGVTRSLINFAMAIVGRFRGGLGHVNILTSVFFAGISGSAIADSAALSRTLTCSSFTPSSRARVRVAGQPRPVIQVICTPASRNHPNAAPSFTLNVCSCASLPLSL